MAMRMKSWLVVMRSGRLAIRSQNRPSQSMRGMRERSLVRAMAA